MHVQTKTISSGMFKMFKNVQMLLFYILVNALGYT